MRDDLGRVPRHQRGATLSSLGSAGRGRDLEERAPRPTARLHARRRALARRDEHACHRGSTASRRASKRSRHASKSGTRDEATRAAHAEISNRSAAPTPTGQKVRVSHAGSFPNQGLTNTGSGNGNDATLSNLKREWWLFSSGPLSEAGGSGGRRVTIARHEALAQPRLVRRLTPSESSSSSSDFAVQRASPSAPARESSGHAASSRQRGRRVRALERVRSTLQSLGVGPAASLAAKSPA